MPFNNSGSVTVNAGTLYLSPATATTSNHSGPFSIANGATLQVAGSGTLNFATTITGAGSGVFSGSTANFISGTYSLSNMTVSGGTVSLNTGTAQTFNGVTLSGGTLTGADTFSITAMTLTGGTLSGSVTTTDGVLGGISTGATITLRVAFKPTSTIRKEQATVDRRGQATTLAAAGRHDPCVVPRAVAVVDAMALLVLADHALRHEAITARRATGAR